MGLFKTAITKEALIEVLAGAIGLVPALVYQKVYESNIESIVDQKSSLLFKVLYRELYPACYFLALQRVELARFPADIQKYVSSNLAYEWFHKQHVEKEIAESDEKFSDLLEVAYKDYELSVLGSKEPNILEIGFNVLRSKLPNRDAMPKIAQVESDLRFWLVQAMMSYGKLIDAIRSAHKIT
jgi:hypothetical protein